MNSIILILIFLTVLLNTSAQLALKIGIDQIGKFTFNWSNLIPITLKIVASHWIILGMVIYVVSIWTWLLVLSRASLSVAYPISSLAYVTSAIAAYYILGENLSFLRIIGIATILVGVYMVAKS